jgi:tetratricopeptide (TPR) repeat protein
MMNRETTVQLDAQNPWPGLLAFNEAARDFFHGRTQETEHLLRLVRRQRLTILYGRSGLGKTSLLNAGLFPLLRQEQFLPVYIRVPVQTDTWLPLAHLREDLATQLHGAGVHVRPVASDESLWEYFHENDTEFWDERNRLVVPVLVFDQFEGVLTSAQELPPVQVFLDQLTDLATNRLPAALKSALEELPDRASRFDFTRTGCKVVLSFREDYLAIFDDVCRRMASVYQERMRLLPMTGRQALDAVLLTGGRVVSERVAEKIITFVAGRRVEGGDIQVDLDRLEVDPALLSLVCRELNNQRIASRREQITEDLLAGARDEIIADFYRSAVADASEGMRLFIEEQLLTSAGFRDSRALADALTYPGVTREAVDRLVERRLLRIEERLGTLRIELAHDVLTPVIRQERDLRRETRAAQVRAEAAEAAARSEREQREVQQRLAREADERALLAGRAATRARRFAAVLGVMSLLVFVASGATLWFWREQYRQERRAEKTLELLTLAMDGAKQTVEVVSDNVRAGRIRLADARRAFKMLRDVVDGISPELGEPRVIQDQIDLYNSLADIYNVMDLVGDMLDVGQRQWRLAERLSVMPVNAGQVRDDKIDAALNIMVGYAEQGDITHAREQGRVALSLLQKSGREDTQAVDQPVPWREVNAHLQIAQVDTLRHAAPQALEQLRLADQGFAASTGYDPVSEMTASIHRWRAMNLAAQGNDETAVAELLAADVIVKQLLGPEPKHAYRSQSQAWIDLQLAELFRRRGDRQQARQRLEAARELIGDGLGFDHDKMDWAELAAEYFDRIGDLAGLEKSWDESLNDHKLFIEDLSVEAAETSTPYYAWPELRTREQLKVGAVRLERGEVNEALQAYQDAEKTASEFGQRQPSFPQFQVHLAAAKFGIGDVRRAMGDNKTAWGAYQAGFTIMQPIVDAGPDDAVWQHDFAMAKSRGAAIRRALGDTAGADADLAFAIASLTGLLKIDPVHAEWRTDLASLTRQQQEAAHAGP